MEVHNISTEETYPLRIEILRKGIAKDYKFVGDDDKDTFHIGAFTENECVGIASCMKKMHPFFENSSSYQLRGMAVKSAIQKSGIGKEIVHKTIAVLKEKNCTLVWCNAREKAVVFYEKLGFHVVGNKFQIPKVGPHYVMYKNL